MTSIGKHTLIACVYVCACLVISPLPSSRNFQFGEKVSPWLRKIMYLARGAYVVWEMAWNLSLIEIERTWKCLCHCFHSQTPHNPMSSRTNISPCLSCFKCHVGILSQLSANSLTFFHQLFQFSALFWIFRSDAKPFFGFALKSLRISIMVNFRF